MTKIEWTDETWNPIIGCSRISPGCDNCYAERNAKRLALNPNAPEEYCDVTGVSWNQGWNGQTAFVESAIERPLSWRKPRRVFVGSMTDLFHPATPFDWIDRIIGIMSQTPHITYQILTKRHDRMHDYITRNMWLANDPRPNIWLGGTIENQEMAAKRIPVLLDTPAAVRFVSVEPMLGPIKLDSLGLTGGPGDLDWVICGGETGPGAREMCVDWARQLRDECAFYGVPFFFKQMTKKAPTPEDLMVRQFPASAGG